MQINGNLFNEIEYLTPNAEFNLFFDETNTDIVEDVIKTAIPIQKSYYQLNGFKTYHAFVQNELKTAKVGIITVYSTLMDAINYYNQNPQTTKRIKLLDMVDFNIPEYQYFLAHDSKTVPELIDRDLLNGTGDGKAIEHFLNVINQ